MQRGEAFRLVWIVAAKVDRAFMEEIHGIQSGIAHVTASGLTKGGAECASNVIAGITMCVIDATLSSFVQPSAGQAATFAVPADLGREP